jgi:hypothetical protein
MLRDIDDHIRRTLDLSGDHKVESIGRTPNVRGTSRVVGYSEKVDTTDFEGRPKLVKGSIRRRMQLSSSDLEFGRLNVVGSCFTSYSISSGSTLRSGPK